MRQPRSPQSRFLARASLCFATLLAAWWFVLLPPLLGWTRLSTDFLLNAVPGAPLKTGVTVSAEGVWSMQAPIKVAGVWRNVRVETGRRLPRQLTIAMPLFWAILLAAPRTRRAWRVWLGGSAVMLFIPPAGLILYAAHVAQLYVFPDLAAPVRGAIAAADYVASTVAPYFGPVLIALAIHPEFRRSVISTDVVEPPSGGRKLPVASGR
jgi:hypothetical protein